MRFIAVFVAIAFLAPAALGKTVNDSLDVDGDRVPDFVLGFVLPFGFTAGTQDCVASSMTLGWYVQPLKTNAVALAALGGIAAVPEGATIDEALRWTPAERSGRPALYLYTSSGQTCPDSTQSESDVRVEGSWYEEKSSYIALRIVRDQRDFFGWALVEMVEQPALPKPFIRASWVSTEPHQAVVAGSRQLAD